MIIRTGNREVYHDHSYLSAGTTAERSGQRELFKHRKRCNAGYELGAVSDAFVHQIVHDHSD